VCEREDEERWRTKGEIEKGYRQSYIYSGEAVYLQYMEHGSSDMKVSQVNGVCQMYTFPRRLVKLPDNRLDIQQGILTMHLNREITPEMVDLALSCLPADRPCGPRAIREQGWEQDMTCRWTVHCQPNLIVNA